MIDSPLDLPNNCCLLTSCVGLYQGQSWIMLDYARIGIIHIFQHTQHSQAMVKDQAPTNKSLFTVLE